jgi:hypothetical protein
MKTLHKSQKTFLASLALPALCFFALLSGLLKGQDVLLAEYKFEVDATGWSLQAYTTIGNTTTNPASARIAGVNWAANGGSAGSIRHLSGTTAGAWFGLDGRRHLL